MASDESLALTKALIKELNKDNKDGKVAWCLATDKDNPTDVRDFISTGSTLLDYIICNRRGGGIPVGKITEIVGEEATGKSLLVTQILAETQRRGGLGVYIDEENALNPEFATRVGLNLDKLVYMQCGSVEAVGEQIEKVINLARLKDVKSLITIVWDSVAATPPKAELEGDYDPNSRVGLQAKAIAKMMRKLTQTVGRERVTLIFTNQMKTKIGVVFGDPMGTPGGKAIPYHASVRIRLYRSTELKEESESEKNYFGVHTRAKLIKNRQGPPLRTCEFDIHFSDGIQDAESIRDYLHRVGEIEKRAGWMYMKGVVVSTEKKDPTTGELTYIDPPLPVGEAKFRSSEFAHMFRSDRHFRNSIMGILDRRLIVSFDAKEIPDMELDPESFTDNEAVGNIIADG